MYQFIELGALILEKRIYFQAVTSISVTEVTKFGMGPPSNHAVTSMLVTDLKISGGDPPPLVTVMMSASNCKHPPWDGYKTSID